MELGVFLASLFATMFAPFLVSLVSANVKVMLVTLSCSVLTVFLSTEDYWSAVPWTIGMLIAVIATYNRFAESAPATQQESQSAPIAVAARSRQQS